MLLLLAGLGAAFAAWRALVRARGFSPEARLTAPRHYAAYVAAWVFAPALAAFTLWNLIAPSVCINLLAETSAAATPPPGLTPRLYALSAIAYADVPAPPDALLPLIEAWRGLTRQADTLGSLCIGLAALAGFGWAWRRVRPDIHARKKLERGLRVVMVGAGLVATLTTVGIALSLIVETARFFSFVSVNEFLFGLHWSPQIALREGQVGASGSFGAVPLFAGTLLITAIALLVAAPVGLFAALATAEYASPRTRAIAKPVLEILAGIPTVVYGFFAALVLAPFIRDAAHAVGLSAASESALAAGVVMGIMIAPFISSLADDVLSAVPQELRQGSYALGATKSETIIRVVLPAAAPGLASALLLAFSRAIGETMIVVMAAGLAANLTANPLEAVTTVTAQIVTLLVGDQEFDSPRTLAAFALGFTLFLITLAVNMVAMALLRRHKGYE